jgi:DNA polymerase III alpha subunit
MTARADEATSMNPVQSKTVSEPSVGVIVSQWQDITAACVQGASEHAASVRKLATQGLSHRLENLAMVDDEAKIVYRDALDNELSVIEDSGFSRLFLAAATGVSTVRARGVPVGPGQASLCSSMASWALGITDIDPIEHNLIFEQAINPERLALPQVDFVFGQGGSAIMTDAILQHFAEARVEEWNCLRSARLQRSTKRPVRLYGRTWKSRPKISATMSWGLHTLASLDWLSRVELDIRKHEDTDFTFENLSLDDVKAYRLLSSGRFSSSTNQTADNSLDKALSSIEPCNFEELIAAVALGSSYVQGRGLLDRYLCARNCEAHCSWGLAPLFPETHGLLLYAEQIVAIVSTITGDTAGQSELFRSQMIRQSPSLSRLRSRFATKAGNNNTPDEFARYLFDKLARCCTITTSRAWAISQALLLYRLAWARVRYPRHAKNF